VFPATGAIFIAKVLKNGDFWPRFAVRGAVVLAKSLLGGSFEFSWKMLILRQKPTIRPWIT
jgi:hypothetical protein